MVRNPLSVLPQVLLLEGETGAEDVCRDDTPVSPYWHGVDENQVASVADALAQLPQPTPFAQN